MNKDDLQNIRFYTMQWCCKNCGEHFMYKHEYGKSAIQPNCPNCGVSPKVERRSDFEERYGL